MLIAIEIDPFTAEWKALTKEQYDRLRAAIPTLPEEKSDWEHTEHIVDEPALRLIVELKLTAKVTPRSAAMNTMLVKMRTDVPHKGGMVERCLDGTIVQITLPDVGLLLIDELTYEVDACTEAIQKALDDGWRIIAVCPPNAQRRPDYILGRRKANAR